MNARTEKDLTQYATIYDMQNDSPFEMPNESLLRLQTAQYIDDAQKVLDFVSKGARDPGASCASNRPGSERLTAEEKFLQRVPPATNRGLVEYHGENYRLGWGGYDGGVEASISGTWEENDFLNFGADLERCKQCADNGDLEGSFIEFGSFLWKVSEKGANSGFFKYKWVLESHGVKLYVHSNPNANVIPVRVRFGFECLARTDLFDAVETLKKCLKEVGFKWETETLSRVDMQVLLPVDIYEFVNAMQGNRILTRCRGKCEVVADCHSLRIQTITFRSQNAEVCIYDKLAQLESVDDVYFMTFHRWILGFENVQSLTRVEFRFRRDMLKRYGITTFSDLKRSEQALPQVFGRDWLRILERDKVRGSENEIKSAPIWQKVLKAFAFYFRPCSCNSRSRDELKRVKKEVTPPKACKVIKQAVGCIASALAVISEKFDTGAEALAGAFSILERYADEIYLKSMERKIIYENVRGYSKGPEYDCKQEIIHGYLPSECCSFVHYL